MLPPFKLTPADITSLFPDYVDVSEIGSGGFKTVFSAVKQEVTEVIKVIGIPNTDGSTQQDKYRDECLQRVRREVRVLSQCKTPFLVKLASLPLDGYEVHGGYYAIYSEELLDGSDLKALIHARTALPNEVEAKTLFRCMLHAIKELWSMQFIHRDIKPANVIKLDDATRPFVLIDLGIAFGVLETGLTLRGTPCTLRYLAPEMANPDFRASLDYRSDLYAAALTVFEYSAGVHPIAHDSDDQVQTVSRALRQPPRPLAAVRPDFSTPFCNLIDQLLKKKPSLRPAKIDSLIEQTLL